MTTRPVFASWLRTAGALLALPLLLFACSSDHALDPLPESGAGGAVVAGTVREASSGAIGAGVPVTLEAMIDGQSASLLAALARPGGLGLAGTESVDQPIATSSSRVVVSDASGRFAFAGVSAGKYLLSAQSRNHLAGTSRFELPTTAAETTFVNLLITPTGTYSGTATLDGETSHGGTIVYVDGTSYIAVTDATGAWVMRQVPTGSHTLIARHEEFQAETYSGSLTAAGDSIDLGSVVLLRDRNVAPTAFAGSTPQCPEAGPVSLSGSGTDQDGTIIRYEWDFEDDGIIDYTSPSSAATTHVYTPGSHRARLSVRDNNGAYGHSVTAFVVPGSATYYVDAAAGGGGTGTALSPFNTLAAGLTAATGDPGCRPIVIVATGTYNETPAFPSKVEVRGGYTPGSWTHTPGNYSDVNVNANGALLNGVNAVRIEAVRFTSANANIPSQSSYAMKVQNSITGIEFVDCSFIAGNCLTGIAGSPGVNGGPGGQGGAGVAGTSNGSGGGTGGAGGSTGSGTLGFPGGAGGLGGFNNQNGFPGANVSTCNTGGSGGSASASCFAEAGNGNSGLVGCNGPNGSNGTAAPLPSFGIFGYVPAAGLSGVSGTGGRGGSGGGGGGGGLGGICNADRGGGGAGGGGGGGGGTGGGGGGGGGASVALYLVASSVTTTDCTFKSGNAGNGGSGGNGSIGGPGGAGNVGGNGPDDGGNGGPSLAGGNGGYGGAGSGGSGGSSVCIVHVNGSSSTNTGASFLTGLAGLGGAGGIQSTLGPAPNGSNGTSTNTVNVAPSPIVTQAVGTRLMKR